MAEAQVSITASNVSAAQDGVLPLVDPKILTENCVMLTADLDVDTVLRGLKPFVLRPQLDDINAETNRSSRIHKLIDLLQRISVQEYAKFNIFMKIVGGTQPELFDKLVGRLPTDTEADFCVERYVNELKEITQKQGHSIDSMLDEKIDFESEYLQLQIVRDKSDSKTPGDLDQSNETHPSETEGKDNVVPAAEVLAGDGNGKKKKPKNILLKGGAGTGKSTTCQWFVREWSFDRWAAGFTLIFLLQLRMLSISSCQITAIELLTLHSLYKVQEADLVCLVSSWLKHSGSRLVILLDGLDEISGFSSRWVKCEVITDLNQKAHPIDICINILRGNLLPGSTVLSASRSFAGLSAVTFDKELEILELTESHIAEFVDKKHPDKAAHIMSVLKTNPLLMSICGITFYCVLICRLLADGVVFDREELQTYTRLTAFILVQYVSRKLSGRWPFVVEVSSFFPKLACLAYNGIFDAQLNEEESKLVFDEYDLSKAKLTPQRLEAVLEVGLLQTKDVKVGTRSSVIAAFIHTSVQEMLASAYFLSHFPLSGDSVSHLFSGGQFNMALRYLFGLQYDTASKWIKDIKHAVNPSGQGDLAVEQLSKFIQDLCEQCGEQPGFSTQLQVCQLLHEGQMTEMAKSVAGYIVPKGKLRIKNTKMTLIDLNAVWFVCERAGVITEISVRKCGLTDTLLGFLTSPLLKDNLKELRVLNLRDNEIGPGGAKLIAEWLKHSHTLHTLDLYGNNVGADGARDIAAALHHNHSLRVLDVGINNIGDNGATAIATALKENTTLQELTIRSHNNIRDTGDKALKAAKRQGLEIR